MFARANSSILSIPHFIVRHTIRPWHNSPMAARPSSLRNSKRRATPTDQADAVADRRRMTRRRSRTKRRDRRAGRCVCRKCEDQSCLHPGDRADRRADRLFELHARRFGLKCPDQCPARRSRNSTRSMSTSPRRSAAVDIEGRDGKRSSGSAGSLTGCSRAPSTRRRPRLSGRGPPAIHGRHSGPKHRLGNIARNFPNPRAFCCRACMSAPG